MKKILYLIPVLLIILSLTPLSLYKDDVDLLLSKDPNAQVEDITTALTALSPSHWKMISYHTGVSADLGSVSFDSSGNVTTSEATQTPAAEPLYKGATFRGFPFAAYFSKGTDSNTANSSSSTDASAYSILWGIIDLVLILGSAGIAFIVNRKKKEVVPAVLPLTPTETTPIVAPFSPQAENAPIAPVQNSEIPPVAPTSPATSPEQSQTPPHL